MRTEAARTVTLTIANTVASHPVPHHRSPPAGHDHALISARMAARDVGEAKWFLFASGSIASHERLAQVDMVQPVESRAVGMREMVLTPLEAQALEQLMANPDEPMHYGTPVPISDGSFLRRHTR